MPTLQDSLTKVLQTSFDDFVTDKKALRTLARNTKALWRGFTTERDKRDPDYMSDKDALQAYVFSFLLPNLERTKGALTRFGSKALSELLDKKQVRILDVGCGPLSASLGVISLLEELVSQEKKIPKSKLPHFQITAVDRTDEGVEFAQDVLKMNGYENVEVKFTKELPSHKNSTFDVVLIANSLNEISPATRKKWINECFLMLSPDGICLLLEPGQDDHSKALIEVRDEFLFGPLAKQTSILGPCLHKESCPLGANSGRKDWCWFRHNWRPPAFLKALDIETELEHRELAYSFLLLQRNKVTEVATNEMKAGKEGKYEGRVVSDTITLSFEKDSPKSAALSNHLMMLAGENKKIRQKVSVLFSNEDLIYKQLLCTNDGTLEGVFTESKAGMKSRGSILTLDDTLLHGPERVSRSPRNLRAEEDERSFGDRSRKPKTRSSADRNAPRKGSDDAPRKSGEDSRKASITPRKSTAETGKTPIAPRKAAITPRKEPAASGKPTPKSTGAIKPRAK